MKRPGLVICMAGLIVIHALIPTTWAAPQAGTSLKSATISGAPIRVGSVTQYILQYPGSWTDLVNGTYAARVDSTGAAEVPGYDFDVDFAAKDSTGNQGCSTGAEFDCACLYLCPGLPCPSPECMVVEGYSISADESDPCTPKDVGDPVIASPSPVANTTASFHEPAFPVPVGTEILYAQWDLYDDVPHGSGYVAYSEYRYFKNGAWSTWRITNPNGAKMSGSRRAWQTEIHELPEAAKADSVQLRHWIQCDPALGPDGINCAGPANLYYDNLGLFAITGVPSLPVFGVFPGLLPQTTFVDGTITGLNCTTPPCWPGVRGTEAVDGPINDNVNSAVGDSIVIRLHSALRTNGMGINWRHGFDKNVDGGMTIAHTNAGHVAGSQTPRMVYRLFDPATRSWSPLDSTTLDADDVQISGGDTIVVGNAFRMDWPPRDKAGLNLPGGFTINGVAAYNDLAYLPRGTRLQCYFKAVDVAWAQAYQFQGEHAAYEVEDLPTLPGSSVKAPDIIEFDVLPRVYAPGSAGTLLAGRTNTPILNLDGSYTAWSFSQDPVIQALRGLGVRADRYRLQQAPGHGNNIGGHEMTGPPDNQRPDRLTNHFPNMNEYSIRESLSTWYRILIQSSHLRNAAQEDESDARLIEDWWNSATPGTNGGDRCVFVSGEDYANALLNTVGTDPAPRRHSYGNNVLGIQSAASAWAGSGSNLHPTIEDRFANPTSGPGLAPGYTYPLDCACPGPNRPDALTRIISGETQNAAFYPLHSGVTDVAAIATMAEKDAVTDRDRSKSLIYGFSVQYVRKAGIPTNASNYVHTGVQERMQILYKFLTSCRGPGAPSDTGRCWPCPTSGNLTGNWANVFGFQTATYGPLYPIQDSNTATGVDLGSRAPDAGDRLDQNRPNPFNPSTTIPFTTTVRGRAIIRIFDVGGRLVRTLEMGALPAGEHSTRWDGQLQGGAPAPSGLYFYQIEFPGGGVSSRKMILLR